MVAMIGLVVFAAALGAAIAVFWLTLAPALPRIAELLADEAPLALRPQPFPPVRQRTITVLRPALAGSPQARRAAA